MRLIGEKQVSTPKALFITKILFFIMIISGGALFVMQMIMLYNAFGVFPVLLSALLILGSAASGYVWASVEK
mgnify:FL=1